MSNQVEERFQISPFLIVFLIYISMVGSGILNFQEVLVNKTGYDSWISIIIIGISTHIIIWMIYRILIKNKGMDIASLNTSFFGKLLGNLLNAGLILYIFLGAFVEFRTYLDVFQVWIFPDLNLLPISIMFIILIYYTVSGGLRTVTGLSFWGVAISYLIVIPFIFLLFPHLHTQNISLYTQNSLTDILFSSKSVLYIFMGFETILVYYPFIKTPEKSQKWAHLSVLFITFFYLLVTIMTFMYFSEGQLRQVLWPTLSMLMIIDIPIFQRLEYLAISVWLIKILANISLGLWAASRQLKVAFGYKRRSSLLFLLCGLLIASFFVKDYTIIRRITDYHSVSGMYFLYLYIPLLFFTAQFKK